MFSIKHSAFVLLMFFSFLTVAHGQHLSVSSYSYFGLGERKFDSDVAIHSMGGIATAYEDPFAAGLNFSNPAANSKVYTALFSTNATIDQVSFSGERTARYRGAFYFSNISLGFPISKRSVFGLGYQPYTGYFNRMRLDDSFDQDYGQQKDIKGSGGLNSFHAFLSYNINENWSVGLRGNFLFGRLESQYRLFPWMNIPNISRDDHIKGVDLTTGMLYTLPLTGGKRWVLGATYGIGNKVTVKRTLTKLVNILSEASDQPEITKDTTNISMRLPMSTSLGLSYSEDYKWMLSAQYDWQRTSELNAIARSGETYRNTQRFALGGYWVPQFNSYKSYFAKVIYRAGLYYEDTSLYIKNQGVSDYGLTLGMGLPIRSKKELQESSSYLNIGLSLGQRGTAQGNPTKESYFSLKMGFTFGGGWFRKALYD